MKFFFKLICNLDRIPIRIPPGVFIGMWPIYFHSCGNIKGPKSLSTLIKRSKRRHLSLQMLGHNIRVSNEQCDTPIKNGMEKRLEKELFMYRQYR